MYATESQRSLIDRPCIVIIILFTQLLAIPLSRLRQPKVIAEVISGVLLGPTVMGRIPGFQTTIFPKAGMPLLNITATIGLILFLFLVGLEIDTKLLKKNVKASFVVSLAGSAGGLQTSGGVNLILP